MKRSTSIRLVIMLVLAVGAALWWPSRRGPAPVVVPPQAAPLAPQPPPLTEALSFPRPARPTPAQNLTAAEKAAQVERIKRDYDEIRAKASAEYAAAAASFPGGLSAFLRQLALLEREKRGDLAVILAPRELEDLEMRETNAGQVVQRFLGDTKATEDQRRSVFRLQEVFEDQFALTFDAAPAALLARESARQETQEKIRAVLGDALFAEWLRGEGSDFAQVSAFVAQQGLPAGSALDLWRAKNDLTLRRLELATQKGLSSDQLRTAQAFATRQAEERVTAILGPGAMSVARNEILGWLPRK